MMPSQPWFKLVCLSLAVVLTGCNGSHDDIDEFMAEAKARPAGTIPPTPVFKAYKAFNYSATGLRSPFEKPVEVREIALLQPLTTVKPNENRAKEFLEQFNLDQLSMVGTLDMGGTLWALINDGQGGVHRVKVGNYMGRNHGKIVELGTDYMALVEIVPNGSDGWIERPRKIALKTVQ
jgi:type IV pilus assembly protein PilP